MIRFGKLFLGILYILSFNAFTSKVFETRQSTILSLVDEFRLRCREAGIQFEDVFIAQFILETGWGSSTLFHKNRNMTGMKRNSRNIDLTLEQCQRWKGLGKCFDCRYSCYISINDSMKDYAAWQQARFAVLRQYIQENPETNFKIPNTQEEYLTYLKRYPVYKSKSGKWVIGSYAEEETTTGYTSLLKKILKKF